MTNMTQAEWLTCMNPEKMVYSLRYDFQPDRKWRLFACACCRYFWKVLPNEHARQIVELAERYEDGLASEQELALEYSAADDRIKALVLSDEQLSNWLPHTSSRPDSARQAAHTFSEAGWIAEFARAANIPQEAAQRWACDALRDIIGNDPGRKPTIDSHWLAWNDRTVRKIAHAIYDDRAFERMPILADALEDAGCDNADILTHCRSGGEHVRGCWVVDLLLGKE